jgi:hypothetical protein
VNWPQIEMVAAAKQQDRLREAEQCYLAVAADYRLEVNSQGPTTVVSDRLTEQSALHGALTKLHDRGSCLIVVRWLGPL